jgi:hypothetical protein
MHSAIVPSGNTLVDRVVRGGNVGVGAVEDGKAPRLLFEMSPVRVCFGDVAADEELICGFTDDKWSVGGERAIRCR